MGIREAFETVDALVKIVVARAMPIRMVELVHRGGFFLHHLGRANPSVMEDAGMRAQNTELLEMGMVAVRDFFSESLRVLPGHHSIFETDCPDLVAIGRR